MTDVVTDLQRIIFPSASAPLDVYPLYVDDSDTTSRVSFVDRRTASLPASSKISFASYFNAFAASYWRRWTHVDTVDLIVSTSGKGRLDLYRSKSNGDAVHLQGVHLEGDSDWTFTVDLAPFEDGGWIWFEVLTDAEPVIVRDGAWATRLEIPSAKVSVGICTFNRPADCLAALRALASEQAVLDVVGSVRVVDQGTQKVREQPGFVEVETALGGRLEILEQDNLGGSGGFTRALLEGLRDEQADQILLLDDDVVLEPESVLRANIFARAAYEPVIVGGQMLNLWARQRLHSMGEIVDLRRFWWRPAPGAITDHNFGAHPLRQTPEAHRRIDVGYNGWWMCLFPREVVQQIGLPLPLFIKWDDAEYGLRAAEMGIPTVTLPGTAIWHMPWTDKDDAKDWQAYFHVRNRLVAASLHMRDYEPGHVIADIAKHTLKHLLSMEYSTVAVQQKATTPMRRFSRRRRDCPVPPSTRSRRSG
jgi:galactofuranosylgalactofuranosylrhamnosyl-N-acetylglucosaminyl-diphospho-decaprenol beta-1,5/1,6-galactofuranosyltransferase